MSITPDLLESIQNTEEVIKEFISDPEKQYWFIRKLYKSLNRNDRSQITGFYQNLTYSRRKIVSRLFHGDNYAEIASVLDVDVKVIRRDVEWLNDNRKIISQIPK